VAKQRAVCWRHELFTTAAGTPGGQGTCHDVIADPSDRGRSVKSTTAAAQLWVARVERCEAACTATQITPRLSAPLALRQRR